MEYGDDDYDMGDDDYDDYSKELNQYKKSKDRGRGGKGGRGRGRGKGGRACISVGVSSPSTRGFPFVILERRQQSRAHSRVPRSRHSRRVKVASAPLEPRWREVNLSSAPLLTLCVSRVHAECRGINRRGEFILAGRFKAVPLRRSCEKRALRQTRRRAARRLLDTAVTGCPRRGFCLSVFLSMRRCGAGRLAEMLAGSKPATVHTRCRGRRRRRPRPAGPALYSVLSSHRGRLHLFIVGSGLSRGHTNREPRDPRGPARAYAVLWTRVLKARRMRASAGARMTPPSSVQVTALLWATKL